MLAFGPKRCCALAHHRAASMTVDLCCCMNVQGSCSLILNACLKDAFFTVIVSNVCCWFCWFSLFFNAHPRTSFYITAWYPVKQILRAKTTSLWQLECCSAHTFALGASFWVLSVLDVESGSGDHLRQEAAKLLLVASRHSALDASHNLDGEKRNSGVHCGRTKVFLTQLMVSHWHMLHPHTLFKAFVFVGSTFQIYYTSRFQSGVVFWSFIRPMKQTKGSGHVGVLTCLAVVLQLDLLEDQRNKILSRCAFSIQCCWRRYQRRRRHTRQQSATLIQAGKL